MSETPERRTPTVYIGSDYARKDEVRALCIELNDMGLEPTSTWAVMEATGDGLGGELSDADAALALAASSMDLADIDRSELFIALTTGEKARGGRHVELGYALARECTVLVVGPREHVFHYGAGVHHLADVTELKLWLRGWLSA